MPEKFKSLLALLGLVLCGLSVLSLLSYGFYTDHFYDEYKKLRSFIIQERIENQNVEQVEIAQPTLDTRLKTVLLWNAWWGNPWEIFFGPQTPEGLRDAGCPIWQCSFTRNISLLQTADAVVFVSNPSLHSHGVYKLVRTNYRRPREQRWILVHLEGPKASKPKNITEENAVWNPSFLVNWTMTYHSNSDVVAFYGYFTALNATRRPMIPNAMAEHPETMQEYKEGLSSGITLSDIMGPDWKKLLNKTKIVAWMSSHCPTISRREDYIRELNKHIHIDTYGKCGTQACSTPRNPVGNDSCWKEVLATYSFYMSMENKICDDYITEKLYLPMINHLVPVVWGGSDYSRYLPPGSYIDARQYHPKDLAVLLTDLHNNPEAYSRYHLWRGYWQVHRGGNFCHLCYRLHTDIQEKHYFDITNWWVKNGKCINTPKHLFNKDGRPEYWKTFLQHHNSTMI